MGLDQAHGPYGSARNVGHADPGVDLKEIVAGIRQRLRFILGAVALITAGMVVFLSMATPQFTSEARILVENAESAVMRSAADLAVAPPDPLAVQSQVEVLRSRDLAATVAEKLNLVQSSEFNATGTSILGALAGWLGFAGDQSLQSARERAIDAFYDRLSVYTVPNSRVIAIEFTSSEPERAANLANTLATTYVDATQAAKFENTRRAAEWLSHEIEKLRRQVADAEAAVEQFRAHSGLFEGSTTTLGRQALSELNSQIVVASSARSEAQARADAIRHLLQTKGSVEGAPEVLDSDLIHRLREQQATLRRQIAELGQTYLPDHPRMKQLDSEMAGLNSQIRSEALKIAAGLEEQARIAGAREQSLRDKLETLKTRAALTGQDEVRLAALEREAAASRNLLETFLARYREASAHADASAMPPGARIISMAQPHSMPSFPRKGPMLLLTIVGSFVIGVVGAFIAEMMNQRQSGPLEVVPGSAAEGIAAAEARQYQAGEAMPEVSVVREAPRRPRISPPLDGRSSEMLRDLTRQAVARLGTRRVLVTSVGANPGKAAVAATLARSLAIARIRTLIIDTDFIEPTGIEQTFRPTSQKGLSELLLGRASFGEVAFRDAISNVEIVTAGSSCDEAGMLLGSERMDVVLSALDRSYDIIVLNGPSAIGQGMGKAMSHRVQFALLVADAEQGSMEAAMLAAQVLIAGGVAEVVPVHVKASATRATVEFGTPSTRLGRVA